MILRKTDGFVFDNFTAIKSAISLLLFWNNCDSHNLNVSTLNNETLNWLALQCFTHVIHAFNFTRLSSRIAIRVCASASFLRSFSITCGGAPFTKRSLESLTCTDWAKPC